MRHIAIFLAEGFEEVEALTVVDICRRAGLKMDMVSVGGSRQVTSSHKVTVCADKMLAEVIKKYIIKPDKQKIPINGNQGENGTLNGRFRFGSTFLNINTATQTIINDVNAP